MAADKASLVAVGFDPTFIDKVISDLGADANAALQVFADYQAKGLSIALLQDMIAFSSTVVPLVLKTVQDVAGLFGLGSGTKAAVGGVTVVPQAFIDATKTYKSLKTAAAPSGAFIQWLIQMATLYGPSVVTLLLALFGIKLPFPLPLPTPPAPTP